MKPVYIAIGSLIVGAAAGFAGGYIYVNKKAEAYIAEQVSGMQEHYNDMMHALEKIEEEKREKARVDEAHRKALNEEKEAIAIQEANDSDEDVTKEYEDMARGYSEGDREYENIYTISPQEYRSGKAGQEPLEFTYYEGDDILADEDGQIVDDYDFLADLVDDSWGAKGATPDCVYIRNTEQGLDCMINKVKGSYSHDVLGIPDADDGDKPRKMRAYYE